MLKSSDSFIRGIGDNFCSRAGKLNSWTSCGNKVIGFSLPAVSSSVRIQEPLWWCHLLNTALFVSACLHTFTALSHPAVTLARLSGSQWERQDGWQVCSYPCAKGAVGLVRGSPWLLLHWWLGEGCCPALEWVRPTAAASWCDGAQCWTGPGVCFGTSNTEEWLLIDNHDLQITDEPWRLWLYE